MVLAHQLFDLIEAKLGMGATPPSPIGDSERPQQQEQTSLIATAGSDIHITDASANEPNATESAPDLQHLFRARDEALLRMLAANAPEQSTPDQSAPDQSTPGSTSSTSATTAGASSGGEETTVTVTVTNAPKTEAAVANVDGVNDMTGSAAAVTVSTAAQQQQPALRTTATSMCSRCREVMSVHPGLHSAVARANGQEPQHTNWTADFIGYVRHFIILIKCDVRWLRRTLDYIFVSSDLRATCAAVVPASPDEGTPSCDYDSSSSDGAGKKNLLASAICPQDGPFPNEHWPSDHLLVEVTIIGR
jgi:hypothetical protein